MLCFFLALVFFLPVAPGYAAGELSPESIEAVWQAQTIDGLSRGVWVIPAEAINRYFAARAENSGSKLKNPELAILDGNKMVISFDSQVGRVALTCEIKQFVHNQTESYAEIYVRKKEVANKAALSWMLKFIPMGALADLYGNPMKDAQQVEAKFSGNTLKVNFRPLVEQSLLSSEIGKRVEISSITTREDALELHTNLKVADLMGLLTGHR